MTEEARKARNAYRRAWNKKNPDKIKAQQIRYWEKKALKLKEEKEKEAAQNENT